MQGLGRVQYRKMDDITRGVVCMQGFGALSENIQRSVSHRAGI